MLAVVVAADHVFGFSFVVVETITVESVRTEIEEKRQTKVANVGKTVVAEEVSRGYLEVVLLNHHIRIKLRVGSSTRGFLRPNSNSHPIIRASHRTRGFKEVGSLI